MLKNEIAWLDLQLQQGARQLHLQKPCNRWKVQDKSKKIIKPTRTYQTNHKFLKRKKIVVQTPNHLTLSRLKK